MVNKISRITEKGKAIYLAYDQGLEHGPSRDFNDKNVDPLYIIEIAKKAKLSGLIFQKGIAEKYNTEIRKSKIPLIVKLNGKTSLYQGDPISRQLCTVSEAIKLGAEAVGYTIYIGSKHESLMFSEFEKIKQEAKKKSIPVIAWIYPRGKSVKDPKSGENLAYAARTALELGADMVKLHWNQKPKDLAWALKSAGRTKMVIAGGSKLSEKQLIENAKTAVGLGVSGLAIGRNIWQSDNPVSLAKKLKKIVLSS